MEARPTPRRRRWLWALVSIPIVLFLVRWRLTAPLDTSPTVVDRPELPTSPAPSRVPDRPKSWPEAAIEGEPAKRFLLDYLEAAGARLERIPAYSATLRKREKIRGKLGPEQTLAIKVRHRPFSVYFKYLSPTPGREILYVDGKQDNKLIIHSNDFAGLLLPRVPIDPKGSIALADNRHPITEAGLANLTGRLIGFRQLDLEDSDAETTLDRVADDRGRTWYRSVHNHTVRNPARPFKRVEVLYDPATGLPHGISNEDWPGSAGEEPSLAESYTYDDVKLDAPLSEVDFDLSNPSYGFRRP